MTTSVRVGNGSDTVDGTVSPSLDGGARRDSVSTIVALIFLGSVVAIEGEARRRGGGRTLRMYASSAASSSFNRGSEVSVVSIADLDPIVRARVCARETE